MGKRNLCGELTQDRAYGPVYRCALPAAHGGPHGGGAHHAREALSHRPRHAAHEPPHRGRHRAAKPSPRHSAGAAVHYGDPAYTGRHRPWEFTQPTLPNMPTRRPYRTLRDPTDRQTYRLGYGKQAPPLGLARKVGRAQRARLDRR